MFQLFCCGKNGEAKQAQIVERLVAAYERGVVSSLAGPSPWYNLPVTGRKKQDTYLAGFQMRAFVSGLV